MAKKSTIVRDENVPPAQHGISRGFDWQDDDNEADAEDTEAELQAFRAWKAGKIEVEPTSGEPTDASIAGQPAVQWQEKPHTHSKHSHAGIPRIGNTSARRNDLIPRPKGRITGLEDKLADAVGMTGCEFNLVHVGSTSSPFGLY